MIERSVVETAQLRQAGLLTGALDPFADDNGGVNTLEIYQRKEILKQAFTHPLSILITNGF
jgi:hypothetical protein